MKSGRFWPIFITSILLFDVGIGVTMIIAANSDPSFAVEKDYYDKAVDWDARQAARRHSDELGWSSEVRIIPLASGHARLVVSLTDADGASLEDVQVRAEVFPNRFASDRQSPSMKGELGGVHVGEFDLRTAGAWEVDLEARRGSDVFIANHRIVIPDLSGGGAR